MGLYSDLLNLTGFCFQDCCRHSTHFRSLGSPRLQKHHNLKCITQNVTGIVLLSTKYESNVDIYDIIKMMIYDIYQKTRVSGFMARIALRVLSRWFDLKRYGGYSGFP